MTDYNNKAVWRYAGIEYDDVANGEGVGAVLFTQYCPHHCYNCQNPQTWDKDGGMIFTEKTMNELLGYYEKTPYANRLTLSGGDPICSPDLTFHIIYLFKKKYPNKQVWLYTGFTFQELLSQIQSVSNEKQMKLYLIIKSCDVIVDGKYDDSKRDITLQFRGSSNQNIINVQETLKQHKLILRQDD